MTMDAKLQELCRQAHEDRIRVGMLDTDTKNRTLELAADALMAHEQEILEANAIDMERGRERNMPQGLLDRLKLDHDRLLGMADGLRQVAKLEDPIGEVMSMRKRPNGLIIGKVRVAIGVVGIIFEARPNVTSDAFGLCFKSGNCAILKGGSDAIHSNIAIVSAMQEALSGILGAYERDFAKHPNLSEFPKISMIWKSVPSQLARENKKFIYKVVKEGARAREYEDALQWLVDARLVHKIYRSSAPGLPIAAYDDLSAFKIYLVDVGLLRRLAQLAPTAFGEGNRLFTEFKGALTENFVLQTLITQFEVMPRYWSQNNPPYEVDFLIQRENDIFPVEVKSEANTTSKSMKKFKELFPDKVRLRIRFSLDNLKLDDDVLNIPLFMADQTDRLIGLALENRKQ